MKIIYLDNSATTRVEEETLQTMDRVHALQYGNPSSLHAMGLEGEKILRQCRSRIANRMFVSEEEFYFTSGGTESNNAAIRGVVEKRKKRGNKLITCKTEHPSVLEVFRYYEQQGLQVVYLDVDRKGRISLEQLERALDKEVLLISIMHVNNETGAIQDLEAIGSLVKKCSPAALFHCDCVQSFGKLPVEPAQWKADLVSLSAHKMHGPKGCGGLYMKKGLDLPPLLLGGGQERGFRSGTENVPAVAGWQQVLQSRDRGSAYDHMGRLKETFLEMVEEVIPNVVCNSPLEEGFAHHILSLSFPGVRGEVLLHALERKGVYGSTGSACSSKKRRNSPVLTAMGLEKEELEGTMRFSFSPLNTLDEIREAVVLLAEEVATLRKFAKRRS